MRPHESSISGDGGNAQAGPSTPRRRTSTPPQIPDSHQTDAAESQSIQKHLDRRRKLSIVPKKKKSHSRLRSGSNVSHQSHDANIGTSSSSERDPAWFEQMNDVDEVDDGQGGGEGVERSLTFDMEDVRRAMPEAVKLFQAGEEFRGVDLDEGLKRGFAWDVMFENQRGIHILGKAYFSSNSLLPTDPSQYTLPSFPLPSASTLVISEPDGGQRSERRVKPSRPWMKHPHVKSNFTTKKKDENGWHPEHKINLDPSRRDIVTAYSLDTFQCPGPQWSWVTPWMINMKVGTDEGGWRYNAWFRRSGWRNHAGPVGWWGWVRRREWVRLRMVHSMEGEDGEEEGDSSGVMEKGTDGSTPPGKKQKKVLLEVLKVTDQERLGDEVVHVTTVIPLDREKLAWWQIGLSTLEEDSDATSLREKLERVLHNADHAESLHRAFTYRSTYTAFVALLGSHGFSLAPSSTSPFPSVPSSPNPDTATTS